MSCGTLPHKDHVYSSSTGHSFFPLKEQVKVSFAVLQRYDCV